MKKLITVCAMVMLSTGTGYAGDNRYPHGVVYDGTKWTTIEPPEANHSGVEGIDGTNLVGFYTTTGLAGTHYGFLYDGTSYTNIIPPGSVNTSVQDIDGSNLVGQYRAASDASGVGHGFHYDMDTKTWTMPIDAPGATTVTYVEGIDGSNLVGGYWGADSRWHGFLYDLATEDWTWPLDAPGATHTFVHGIDGSTLVGRWSEGDLRSGSHSFIYDLTTKDWTVALDYPGATHTTVIYDTDGGNHVGSYSFVSHTGPWHGFVYDGTKWTTYDMPGMASTAFHGCDGSNLVGNYVVPEPSTLVLLSMGTLALLACAWRRRWGR